MWPDRIRLLARGLRAHWSSSERDPKRWIWLEPGSDDFHEDPLHQPPPVRRPRRWREEREDDWPM